MPDSEHHNHAEACVFTWSRRSPLKLFIENGAPRNKDLLGFRKLKFRLSLLTKHAGQVVGVEETGSSVMVSVARLIAKPGPSVAARLTSSIELQLFITRTIIGSR